MLDNVYTEVDGSTKAIISMGLSMVLCVCVHQESQWYEFKRIEWGLPDENLFVVLSWIYNRNKCIMLHRMEVPLEHFHYFSFQQMQLFNICIKKSHDIAVHCDSKYISRVSRNSFQCSSSTFYDFEGRIIIMWGKKVLLCVSIYVYSFFWYCIFNSFLKVKMYRRTMKVILRMRF